MILSVQINGKMMERLGDIAHIRIGLTLSRSKAMPSDTKTYAYKSVSINAFPIDGTAMLKGYENLHISSEQISSDYLTQRNDVLVRLREPIRSVYISKEDEDMLVPSLIAIIRTDSKILLGEFLTYYLNSSLPQTFFQSKVKGTTIPMIKLSDLRDLKISLPSIKKQKTIIGLMQESDKQTSLLSELIKQKTMLKHQIFKTLISKE